MNDPLKPISIDQLAPGMFVAGVDVPWYRAPFLSHKRLINNLATIRTMRECGIRTVTIDVTKGTDVCAEKSEANPGQEGIASRNAQAAPGAPAAPEKAQFNSIQSLYAEAHEAVERIFSDLEQGVPPSPAAAKAVVSGVLMQIVNDRTAVMTHLALQQLRQFDRSLGAHALDTCVLSLVVAIESELDGVSQAHLGMGALLHDAGYVRFPRNLVRRRQECGEQERLVLRQHPALGVALLADKSGIDEAVVRIVAEHHERGNGSGYPAGLKTDGISQLSSIVGIIDWYGGMISRRGGRPAMLPHDAVRQLFLAGELGWFEKPLVEIVIRTIGVYPTGSLVLLNTGEQGVVVGVNPRQRLKPIVKIVSGPQGKSYTAPLHIDLAAQTHDRETRTIVGVLDPVRELVNIAMYLDEASPQAA